MSECLSINTNCYRYQALSAHGRPVNPRDQERRPGIQLFWKVKPSELSAARKGISFCNTGNHEVSEKTVKRAKR
ncbi:unnamed protein product [Rangifer tarandus platyrhynchus]|uniref:Uncharacterized protein n=1 Tax=Rangifer tarandus platyrhynchus TaxID=3082113 RepID=A0ABN9A3E9_RANTA|nr:unnamed protein product [Rangifer tarandus platyrhynchus]